MTEKTPDFSHIDFSEPNEERRAARQAAQEAGGETLEAFRAARQAAREAQK